MSRKRTFSFYLAAFILILIITEIVCGVALRIVQGRWVYTLPRNYNYDLFEPDSNLVNVPRKNVSVAVHGVLYHHNADGFRGDDFEKKDSKKRILCIGGSTTYGVGVSNHQTWPYYLDSLLQPDWEVLNLGIPGHSTVEHKKLLPEAIKKFSPDAVILHCGLNDLRNMHVKELGEDYFGFHRQSLYASMGFCLQDRLPRIALVRAGFLLLQKAGVVSSCSFRDKPPAGTISDEPDSRVMVTYGKNLDTLIADCAEKNIPLYLLPQVLSENLVTDENLQWWIPYLTKKGILQSNFRMNEQMGAKELVTPNMHFIPLNDNVQWTNADFYDASHLNAAGDKKLAAIVARALREPAVGSDNNRVNE